MEISKQRRNTFRVAVMWRRDLSEGRQVAGVLVGNCFQFRQEIMTAELGANSEDIEQWTNVRDTVG